MPFPYPIPVPLGGNQGTSSGINDGSRNILAYDILRAHLSPAFNGPAWEALLEAVATGDEANWDNIQKAFDQLFLSSSSGTYLDAHGSKDGVPRPEGVGMSDEDYRKLIIALRTRKLSADAIYRILEVFYGEGAVRAYVQLGAGPFDLTDTYNEGCKLFLEFENGTYTIDFADGFTDLSALDAETVANYISLKLGEQGSKAYATVVNVSGTNYLHIYSGALGLKGYVKVLGGLAAPRLGFITGARTISVGAGVITITRNGYALDVSYPIGYNLSAIQNGDYVTFNSGSYVGLYEASNVDVDGRSFSLNPAAGEAVSGTYAPAVAEEVLAYAPIKYTLQESPDTAIVSVTRGGVEVSIPAITKVVDRTEETASYLDADVGPFIYDPINGLSLTARQSTTTADIRIQQTLRSIPVADSTDFNDTGWVVLGLGHSYQTGPIKFIGKNVGNLIIDSSTVFTKAIPSGATVIEVLGRGAWQPELDQYDDEFTLTNDGVGLRCAKDTIESVTGGGLPIQVNVQYPSGYGYGGHLSPVSDIVRIYGGDEPNEDVQEVLDAT